eukprot:TRINITY_DN5391_c0_g3_i1.p1 TRINITY_DN5391_c0_g3~~TRINITY_DN5391_c0_g3_i1.p1  ORF type:complete len:264 (-),score=62.19 TRINITY_DN5391_c0_g3_i1:207-953(-)
MSKPLSTRLLEAFEAHGALQLPADHFLIILRTLGATVSAREGAALAKKFRKDAEGHVDVQRFCEWFTGMEQDPRFAEQKPTSLSPGALENPDAAGSASDVDVGAQPAEANSSSTEQVEANPGDDGAVELVEEGVGAEDQALGANLPPAEQDEANLGDGGAVEFVEEGPAARYEEPERPSVSFSRQVTANDDSVWSLGSEDRCTLPSHRRLSEHERLMADFRASLNEVKARLEASPVTYRSDLRRSSIE